MGFVVAGLCVLYIAIGFCAEDGVAVKILEIVLEIASSLIW